MATKIYIKETFWLKPSHSVWLDKHIKSLKNNFIYYVNALGYQIDSEMLDLKFKQLIKKAKDILKK